MPCAVLSYLTLMSYYLSECEKMLQCVVQNRSRSILHEKLWTKRSLFEIASVFTLSARYVTWCNWHTLKNAKYFLEICPAGWYGHCLCTWFCGCSSLHPILPVYDLPCCCYLRSVVLVANVFGVETIVNAVWLVYSHLVIFVSFSGCCPIMHIHDVYCINMLLWLLRLVIVVFASCLWVASRGVHSIWCIAYYCCNCYDHSCWLLLAVVYFV